MTRRRTAVLLVVPLLLLALTGFFWVRGRRRADVAAFFTPGGKVQAVASHRGSILLFVSNLPFRAGRGMSVDADSVDARTFDDVRALLDANIPAPHRMPGFEISGSGRGAVGRPGGWFGLAVIPDWFVAVLCLAGPLRWWQLRRRTRRRKALGRCADCGYDLRGNDSGRCPECGVGAGLKRALDGETRDRAG